MLMKADKNKVQPEKYLRVPDRIYGTAERPRLIVFGSQFHTYAQLIDDEQNKVIAMASSYDKDFENTGNIYDDAEKVGAAIAKKALEKGINEVFFDSDGIIPHGRVMALAVGAREGGLNIFENGN